MRVSVNFNSGPDQVYLNKTKHINMGLISTRLCQRPKSHFYEFPTRVNKCAPSAWSQMRTNMSKINKISIFTNTTRLLLQSVTLAL